MVRPTIKKITVVPPSPITLGIGFEEHLPNPSYFGFPVTLIICGSEDEEESFRCFACSPSWLMVNFQAINNETNRPFLPWHKEAIHSSLLTQGLVLMKIWSREELWQEIDRLCGRCTGPTWSIVAERLSRWLDWEYEYSLDEYLDESSETFVIPRYA